MGCGGRRGFQDRLAVDWLDRTQTCDPRARTRAAHLDSRSRQYLLNELFQSWQVPFNHAPDDLQIDAEILVDDHVAKTARQRPRVFRSERRGIQRREPGMPRR